MELGEWLRRRAPDSADRYLRYFEKYEGLLEGLDLASLPCNSWVLKLAGHYLDFLLYNGELDAGEYARLRLELQARRRACSAGRGRKPRGVEACPDRAVMPDARRTLYWVARALLESGVRLSSLHRAAVYGAPLEAWEGGVAVIDLGEVRGLQEGLHSGHVVLHVAQGLQGPPGL